MYKGISIFNLKLLSSALLFCCLIFYVCTVSAEQIHEKANSTSHLLDYTKDRLTYVVNGILLNTIEANKIKDVELLGVFNEGIIAQETAFIITKKYVYIFDLKPFSKENDFDLPRLFNITDEVLDKIKNFKDRDFENEKIPVANLSTDNSAICLAYIDDNMSIRNVFFRYFFPSTKIKELVSEIIGIKNGEPLPLHNFKTAGSSDAVIERRIIELAEFFINKIKSDLPISLEDEAKIFGKIESYATLPNRLGKDLASLHSPGIFESPQQYSPLCELLRLNRELFLPDIIAKTQVYISPSSWEYSNISKKYGDSSGPYISVFIKLIHANDNTTLMQLSYNPIAHVFCPDFEIYRDGKNLLKY